MSVDQLQAENERLRRRVAELAAMPAAAAVLRAQGELETVLNSISDGLVVMDRGWRFTYVSATAGRLVGLQREQMLDRTLWELFPDAKGTDFEANFRHALESGEPQQFQACYPRPTERWMECRCHPTEGGLTVSFHDVTARKQAEEALRHSEERLALAREAAGLGIYDYDILADRLEWDLRTREVWGVTPDEPVTIDTFTSGVHPDDRVATRAAVLAARDPDGPGLFRTEYRVLHRQDGSEHWISSTGRVVFDGRVAVRVVGTLQDITQQKRAEQALRASEMRLRTFFESEMMGAIYWTLDGRIIDANDRFLRMVGYSREDLASGAVRWDAMTPPEYRALDAEALQQLKTPGTDRQYEKEFIAKDGHRIQILIGAAMLDDTEGVAFVLDISARKQADAALAAAKTLAEEANRQKDHFLAMLGHELRNPLAPIRNTVAVLQRIVPEEPRFARALGVIERQVLHMTRMIDDLLDVSRVGRGKIKLQQEEFDLVAVVQAAVEDHRPFFDANGVQLTLATPPAPLRACGDSARVAQIVSNLTLNANKFSNRGGMVAVEVRALGERDASITVHDSGIGIEPDMLRSIFEPFAQADHSIARSSGGLGLGLALVKGLTELHGGTVSARSDGLGRGAEFLVKLPILLTASEPACADRAPASDAGTTKRVLIVEDNVDAAETLKELLQLDGHAAAVVHTGRSALEAARHHRPDVVLCDIGLPDGMDGYAVARALRQDARFAGALLVAMTGYGLDEDKALARAAGFDRHLTKPVEPEVLLRLLAT
jgi:PAS domain S-box-containing protein